MIKVQSPQEHTPMMVMFMNNIGIIALTHINGEDIG